MKEHYRKGNQKETKRKPKGTQKETKRKLKRNGKMIKEKSLKKRISKNLKQRVMGEKEKKQKNQK
jgi:hypothetical protein